MSYKKKFFFQNPYDDYRGQLVEIDEFYVRNLMKIYVKEIIKNTRNDTKVHRDIYDGDTGIAFMFHRLCQTNELVEETSARENALHYINRAKWNYKSHQPSKKQPFSFYYGYTGIFGVSAAISDYNQKYDTLKEDLRNFQRGFNACRLVDVSKVGRDEFANGRAGFLSGVYWLNRTIRPKPFSGGAIIEACELIVESGRQYSRDNRSSYPLMYQDKANKSTLTEDLGIFRGVSGILLMLLESPWFSQDPLIAMPISRECLADIKNTIDAYLALQEEDGNFPMFLACSKKRNTQNRIVQWCSGAPGNIYLILKAYQIFNDLKYLNACRRIADLIWEQGLLIKGPGLCHGIAGNGYAFLMLYKVTQEPQYLYRAMKFAKFLNNTRFVDFAEVPSRPFSLYKGIAGTVCFLNDLLHIDQADFPFLHI